MSKIEIEVRTWSGKLIDKQEYQDIAIAVQDANETNAEGKYVATILVNGKVLSNIVRIRKEQLAAAGLPYINENEEAEDNSLGATLYQGKTLNQWEKEFDGEFNVQQLFRLIRSGIDLGRIKYNLANEADNANIVDNPVFKDEEFFFNETQEQNNLAETTDEEAALDESAREAEDVVTVEDFIELLRRKTNLDDKLIFRNNKKEMVLLDVNSKGGVAVVDTIVGKNQMNEDVELDLNVMRDDFMTVMDLARLGKQAYPHNSTGWMIDNIAGVVDGKVIDFKNIKYARPEGYPSNGTFFLLDGKSSSDDAVKTEIGIMLSENEETPEKWEEAADWFNANGYPIEDDKDRLEQLAPQGSQFLFKAGHSPTGEDKVVPFEVAWKSYKELSKKPLNENEGGIESVADLIDELNDITNSPNSTSVIIKDSQGNPLEINDITLRGNNVVISTQHIRINEGRSWYGGGYGGTGRSYASFNGSAPRGKEIGWYSIAEIDPKAKGKCPGWRCGPAQFPFVDALYPNRRYKKNAMMMRNRYVKAGSSSGSVQIGVASYFDAVKNNDEQALTLLRQLNIPLDLTFGMDPNDDYSNNYTVS